MRQKGRQKTKNGKKLRQEFEQGGKGGNETVKRDKELEEGKKWGRKKLEGKADGIEWKILNTPARHVIQNSIEDKLRSQFCARQFGL